MFMLRFKALDSHWLVLKKKKNRESTVIKALKKLVCLSTDCQVKDPETQKWFKRLQTDLRPCCI